MTAESQRDVVFTPFMLRVRAAADGENRRTPVPLKPAAMQRVAWAADQWFCLRCRCEQVIAEANAMLTGRAAAVDLIDEFGTRRLAFTLSWGDRSCRVWLGQTGRQGWVQLERSYQPASQPEEPGRPVRARRSHHRATGRCSERIIMTDSDHPEIGSYVDAGGIKTNYLEVGDGPPVVLVHGSGPGVTAYANWRLTMPGLAPHFRVLAPDMAGFGFSDKPGGVADLAAWVGQIIGFLDALGIERASVVGNSFGGSIGIRLATDHPDRVDRLVLMGATGISFPITEGLDQVWGYQPSFENMRRILDYFAYSRELVNDELAEVRYRAALAPGVQEAFSALFPAPRQRWVEAITTPKEKIKAIPHETLIIHGREDKVIPLDNAYRLLGLIERSELHVFGRCGHWSQIEWAADFNALLVRFLGRDPR